MPEAQTLREVVDQIADKTLTKREKAVALHDYVREDVK
jgi:hypothetical protein